MGMWIHVFCRSDAPLRCGEAMDHIRDGYFFDDDPSFRSGVIAGDGTKVELENDAIDRDATRWAFDVVYGAEHRPIQIAFGPADATTFETIHELLQEHPPAPDSNTLVAQLQQTRQELVLHFSSAITDDGWAMLDSLEAFVARTLDGLVYASEGIYDENLRLLWSFDRR